METNSSVKMHACDHDLVIRGGTVLDGSLRRGFTADVAISNGIIRQVGRVMGMGRQEIEAAGMLVTPGFVDIHTHYDGQVTWENRLSPSTNHGVSTVVIGNCGVGFAPCRPEEREMLVKLMEGVEDIPEIVLTTGIPWTWQTFGEYLEFLSARQFDADCAAFLPHAALRVFVMGMRGAKGEPSTAEDRRRMTELVTEAMNAGAVGVSTSRTLFHRYSDGVLAPHVLSGRLELLALAQGMRNANKGVFQLAAGLSLQQTKNYAPEAQDITQDEMVRQEIDLYREIAEASGRPLIFSLTETKDAPGMFRDVLAMIARVNTGNISIRAQTLPRPVGILCGLALSLHPFKLHPSYQAIDKLPLPARVAKMHTPEFRRKILSESPDPNCSNPALRYLVECTLGSYLFGRDCNYSPAQEQSLKSVAAKRGVSLWEAAYDALLQDGGKSILYLPMNNFCGGNLNSVYEMITDTNCLIGLGDGGAHYGFVCDASFPTFVLTYWTRDRQGPLLSLPQAIHAMTRRNALALGFDDRGLIAVGYKADINVIDYDRLQLHAPEVVYDLPADGLRIIQRASGYLATILNGELTYLRGEATGALPGRFAKPRPFMPTPPPLPIG
jgi:N-acyl-D-amino-acid deacylase